jgi:transcriptional regulator with XRE-family HTH domain
MGGRALGPLRVPEGFWAREEVHQALAERSFAALFRLLAQYAGASQTQIAIAVGMTQGQVSTIMAGERRVTSIEVVERAFDGLDAPDRARVAFGLAPRRIVGWEKDSAGSPRLDRKDTGSSVRPEAATEDDVRRRDLLRLGGTATLGSVASSAAGAGDGLARVARALSSYELLGLMPVSAEAPPTVAALRTAVRRAKRDYQACRYSIVLGGLADLLESVQLLCSITVGDERRVAWGLAAEAYQVAGSIMLKLGDLGLAAFAADRSMDAAARSQDPVTLAASTRLVTHSLMRGGHAQRAQEVASRAAERLGADLRKPSAEAVSVYGALLLRGAIAAASREDRMGAGRLLDEASEAARRLGRDDNAQWTAFGPTNVAQHRVHVAMLLGDAGTAIDLAGRVDLGKIAIAERKASLFIDAAEAFAQWGKHERAYHALRAADEIAPEEVRARQTVRRLVADLVYRSPRTVKAQVREFAEQIGVDV